MHDKVILDIIDARNAESSVNCQCRRGPESEMKEAKHTEYLEVRPEWLELHTEEALEPALPIIDSHHHLWNISGWQYMLPDFLSDVASGHNISASVFVQCYSMFRKDGPRDLRSLGETEFANGMAAMAASGGYGNTRVCDGIVGYVNLALGDRAAEILEQHVAAAGGRFKGVRHITAWSSDEAVQPPGKAPARDLMQSPPFLAGFACLERLGLSFDAWVFHPQLDQVEILARRFPQTQIVLEHVGGPVRIGRCAAHLEDARHDWEAGMGRLAQCPNVSVKLGGLGMALSGFDFHKRASPPSSEELAAAWYPYINCAIELFGPTRCMFESNFPVDKGTCGYGVVWNAFKRITQQYTSTEKARLFSGTASEIYKLGVAGGRDEP
jgi:L-fuconolactonase